MQAARQATAKTGADLAQGLSAGTRKALATWLGVCTAWVGSLVVLGGLTRLTRSGLSMTDWKFTGEAPPQSEVGHMLKCWADFLCVDWWRKALAVQCWHASCR